MESSSIIHANCQYRISNHTVDFDYPRPTTGSWKTEPLSLYRFYPEILRSFIYPSIHLSFRQENQKYQVSIIMNSREDRKSNTIYLYIDSKMSKIPYPPHLRLCIIISYHITLTELKLHFTLPRPLIFNSSAYPLQNHKITTSKCDELNEY